MIHSILRSLAIFTLFVSCGGGCSYKDDPVESPQDQENLNEQNPDDQSKGEHLTGTPVIQISGQQVDSIVNQVDRQVIVPTVQQFQQDVKTLNQNVQNLCTAATLDEVTTAQDKTKDSWRTAIDTWQKIEVMQIGKDLINIRDKIYSWPVLKSACSIDQQVVNRWRKGEKYEAPDYATDASTFANTNLNAMEYLLFDNDFQQACTNLQGPQVKWDALNDFEKAKSRCEYMQVIMQHLNSNVQAMVGVVEKGINLTGNTPVEKLSHLTDAFFYLEYAVKDSKLSLPFGLKDEACLQSPIDIAAEKSCYGLVENALSRHSLRSMQANVEGAYQLLTGNPLGSTTDQPITGLGSALTSIGESGHSLFEQLRGDLLDLYNQLNSLNTRTSLQDMASAMDKPILKSGGDEPQCQDEYKDSEACKLFLDTHGIGRSLKKEFVDLLGVKLPARAAGDTD